MKKTKLLFGATLVAPVFLEAADLFSPIEMGGGRRGSTSPITTPKKPHLECITKALLLSNTPEKMAHFEKAFSSILEMEEQEEALVKFWSNKECLLALYAYILNFISINAEKPMPEHELVERLCDFKTVGDKPEGLDTVESFDKTDPLFHTLYSFAKNAHDKEWVKENLSHAHLFHRLYANKANGLVFVEEQIDFLMQHSESSLKGITKADLINDVSRLFYTQKIHNFLALSQLEATYKCAKELLELNEQSLLSVWKSSRILVFQMGLFMHHKKADDHKFLAEYLLDHEKEIISLPQTKEALETPFAYALSEQACDNISLLGDENSSPLRAFLESFIGKYEEETATEEKKAYLKHAPTARFSQPTFLM